MSHVLLEPGQNRVGLTEVAPLVLPPTVRPHESEILLSAPALDLIQLRQRPRTVIERFGLRDPEQLQKLLIRDDLRGHVLKSRVKHLPHLREPNLVSRQQRILAWLRDHIDGNIPRHWYELAVGHDLHLSTMGMLSVRHFHASLPDPFEPDKLGWWENLGIVSFHKVTVAFRDFEIDQLQTESALYGDFKYHEVGTSAQAEANTDTALITTTGIARVAGTQTEASASEYRTVATVTADTTETWQEHGVFNATTAGTLMDRSLISPTVAVVLNDTVQFTYTLQKNAEA